MSATIEPDDLVKALMTAIEDGIKEIVAETFPEPRATETEEEPAK